ncbi:hypothetical protein NLU13_8244 [Sarocladium strictum]|uniref:Tyrosinase copper-binding domain-containing protein n=1 Tax=Sarocladium strictum TaxID=5046 RepID=A0AA39L4Z1_SARSR|nr:hypothetical protein NLU13_8244 [Sarocladium strictum]
MLHCSACQSLETFAHACASDRLHKHLSPTSSIPHSNQARFHSSACGLLASALLRPLTICCLLCVLPHTLLCFIFETMPFIFGVTTALVLVSGLISAAPNLGPQAPTTEEVQGAKSVEDFRNLAIQALEAQQSDLQRCGEQGTCTLANARVRRDWEHMSRCERKQYIKAVKCLWTLPAVDTDFSAAQNYYDEFVAIHANLTDLIHGTANFFTWHRYLIHLWEETLRDECGYRGALPYWNWYKYQSALHLSPVFDGSDTSFGSTGKYFKHNGSLVGSRTVWLPPGEGGGCIKDGPFVGYTINLGPIRPAMNGYEPWMKDQRLQPSLPAP